MKGIYVDKRTFEALEKISRKRRAKTQHPEKADVIEAMLDRLDELEEEVKQLKRRLTGKETRIENLTKRVIEAELRKEKI